MRRRFALFLSVFLVVFGSLTYYVGVRGWQWVQAVAPQQSGLWLYWVVLIAAGLAFPLSRFSRGPIRRPLALLGGLWLAVLLYLVPLLFLIDVGRWAGLAPLALVTTGAIILALLVGTLGYGVWSARNPVVVTYEIEIPKGGGKHKDLHAVLVSDTHLGAATGRSRLQAMVHMVNELKPDLVLLGGDLIDDDLAPFVEEQMADDLRGLKSRLGVFAVLGNHDYRAGSVDFRRQMELSNIRLLTDEWALVDDSFYVIGRKDRYDYPRKALSEVLEGVDTNKPLILMDHQPSHLAEAEQAGVDLLVSGHTHRGQMFPNHLLTRRVFEVDWGYLRKGATHVVVSLGFGTWGPPVRIGNRPEVVSIRVRFVGNEHMA